MGMFDPSALAESVQSEPGLVHAIVLAESGRLQDAAAAAATESARTTTPQSGLVLWFVLLSASIFAPDIDRCKQLIADMTRYSLPAESAE